MATSECNTYCPFKNFCNDGETIPPYIAEECINRKEWNPMAIDVQNCRLAQVSIEAASKAGLLNPVRVEEATNA